ncbi:MAG: hypothetical protein KJO95_12635 [Gammaproteobacteria bacterium]|nr:hypothetical protein [Gammaproteobacteria bacterium]NNC56898.1 hypothetical protein [Woeseiaceae bacterium]
MKYAITLFLGVLVGAAVFVAGLIYNPFIVDRGVSPLSLTDSEVIRLNFSGVPTDAVVYTNDGESRLKPFPKKVLQLWEPSIASTDAMATVLRDARSQTAGIGVKFSSHSERTRLLKGEAMIDSVWYAYLPGRGSLFVEQSENYWQFLRDVVVPAYRSSANNWKGSWIGNLTAGPGALGTAAVTGGSGSLKGLKMEGVESLLARAYSVADGPVSAEGSLLIELPGASNRPDEGASDD